MEPPHCVLAPGKWGARRFLVVVGITGDVVSAARKPAFPFLLRSFDLGQVIIYCVVFPLFFFFL